MANGNPLQSLYNWQPFRIDALGLITMLGAEQLNRSIGRLVPNRLFEYCPLLCAFVVAGDQITEPVAGLSLYNVTDAIFTTHVSGWLSRWLLSQDLRDAGTSLEWTVSQNKRPIWREECIAVAVGLLLTGPLLVLTVLMGDWLGLANVLAMLTSVVTRWHIVGANRNMLDKTAVAGEAEQPRASKLLCVLPNGKAVVMYASQGVTRYCFTKNPSPQYPRIYLAVRMLGWLGFAVQIIAIGMSTLLVQIYTVLLVVIASFMTVYGVGADEDQVCRQLCVRRNEHWESNPKDRRQNMYASLNLSEEEEQLLLDWNLFPKKINNQNWWVEYRKLCESTGSIEVESSESNSSMKKTTA
jgi:hypothetical protein